MNGLNLLAVEKAKTTVISVLEESFIESAKSLIKQYDMQTDAILMSEGLEALKDMFSFYCDFMLSHMMKKNEYLLEELYIRVNDISKIIIRARKDRPSPKLTTSDVSKIYEIKELMMVIDPQNKLDSLDNIIIPFMLEASGM